MSEMRNKSEIYSLTMECFLFTHSFQTQKGLKIAVDQVSAKPTVCQMNDTKTAMIRSLCEYFE